MTAHRSIRIRMADRPGALSAVGAALAAHRVDIVRLDVVSHEDGTVVDDLFLAGDDEAALDRATSSFFGDVEVRPLRGFAADPVVGIGAALGAVASATGKGEALAAIAEGVQRFISCDTVAILRGSGEGGYDILFGPPGLPAISADATFAFRSLALLAELGTSEPWAPPDFMAAFRAARVAAVPCGPGALLLVGRHESLKFYSGELSRLETYAAAGANIAASRAPA